MNILNLILPVFAIIILGWLCGYFKLFNKEHGNSLIKFALYIAMPALLFLTIAKEPIKKIFNWPFIISFGGGTLIVFSIIFLINRFLIKRTAAYSAISALTASMTNTGFIALPLLLAIFGTRGVLPAAIATVFVVVVMFPLCIIIIEADRNKSGNLFKSIFPVAKQSITNPMISSTILGILYSLTGLAIPEIANNFLTILAAALTPCALFAIGLEMNMKALQIHAKETTVLTVIKLIILPMVVFVLTQLLHVEPFLAISAILCSAVPTAKTTYVLAAQYQLAPESVAATISATTIFSIITLFILLLILAQLWPAEFMHGVGGTIR